ncbi:MAG: Hpt domain-containing protein, partial [Treponemataceae bacterium]|nr:Hpt domain-containing protein [Treponemataceae bacterium]
MSDGLDKMADIFLDEATDLLEKLEDHLLKLEQDPDDMDTVGAVFRTMHTIKGSAGMFGFNAVSRFTHQAENTFDEVRNGRVVITSDLITLTLKARDHIKNMLSEPGNNELTEITENLISQFQVYLLDNAVDNKQVEKQIQTQTNTTPDTDNDSEKTETSSATTVSRDGENEIISFNANISQLPREKQDEIKPEEQEIEETTYRISFEPDMDVFLNGTKPHTLIAELADMGDISIIPYYSSIPSLRDIDPIKCYMSWDIILTTKKSVDDIKDVFMFL